MMGSLGTPRVHSRYDQQFDEGRWFVTRTQRAGHTIARDKHEQHTVRRLRRRRELFRKQKHQRRRDRE